MTKKEIAEAGFEELFNRAHSAGMLAGMSIKPRAMVVGSPSTPFGNEIDRTQPVYVVEDGVCGFAWVVVKPGTSPFARWLKKTERGSKHYYGGISIWVSHFNQSMQKKEAYARRFAEVLNEHGVCAHSGSRMD
jgi:hypothetical protein